MKKKILLAVLCVPLIVVAIIWGNGQLSGPSGDTLPIETAYIVSDYITLNSISDLTKQSDIIVIGTVVGVSDQKFNTARDTQDHSKPASDLAIKGTIYEVQVEQFLKGEGDPILFVVQSEDILLPGMSPAAVHISESFEPLMVNARYLFFLTPGEPYPDSPFPNLQHGVAEPYRFRLEEGQAKVESPWAAAAVLFPTLKEDQLLQQVALALGK